MPEFNIQMLNLIEPPRFHCAKCLALFWDPAASLSLDVVEECTAEPPFMHMCPQCRRGHTKHTHPLCPICRVRYLSASPDVSNHVDQFLLSRHPSPWTPLPTSLAWEVSFLEHCRQFGAIAMNIHRGFVRPGAGLLQVMSSAQAFVHCISFGPLASQIMQVFLQVARRVPVRGIIANADSYTIDALAKLQLDYPWLTLKPQRSGVYLGDIQYQQLFVIDGLIAFRGSANDILFEVRDYLPRKAVLDVITESDAVFALHNRYFSPAWAQESHESDVIIMT